MSKNITFIFIFFIIFNSCKKEKLTKEEEIKPNYNSEKLKGERLNLNISILLDLSDRINPKKNKNPTMDFYQRDIGYIKSIAESFEIHVRNKKSIKIDDKIQLFIDPEPSEKKLNEKIKSLKIAFTRNNAKRNLILQTSKNYERVAQSIYESAITDDNYIGSDIWRFFKNKVKDYCIEDGYRNILIILTDGYLYHKNSKKIEKNRSTYLTPNFIANRKIKTNEVVKKDFGFIAPISDLENLEVLVLGINPINGNLNDEEIIHYYFLKWFQEMNVKRFEVKNSDLPSNMDKVIKSFIFKNN